MRDQIPLFLATSLYVAQAAFYAFTGRLPGVAMMLGYAIGNCGILWANWK